ncbi:MAG: hypothetical protein MUE73_11760 [Planctomycetes bacterium]|nr:hypothetical protein [Planctomycetota bacterium]
MMQRHDRILGRCGVVPVLRAALVAAVLVAASPGTALAQLPEFLRPGARLSWAAGDSVLEGSRFVPDPQGAIWRNNAWHRLETGPGSGGVGTTQLNIVAVDAGAVLVDVRTFLILDVHRNIQVASGSDAITGDANGIGDYWVHPGRLAQMQPGRDAGGMIFRGRRTLDGQEFDVVSTVAIRNGVYHSQTYDLASGLLLFGGTMDAEPDLLVTNAAGTILNQKRGRVAYSHRRLASVRTVAIPWATAPPPPWFRPGLVTDYQGVSRAVMDQSQGLPPLPGTAMRVSFAFERVAAGGVLGRQVITSALGPGLPDDRRTSPRAFGPAMFDGLWIPPGALSALIPGQRLDADPLTGQVVTFAGAEGGRAVLVSEGPGDRLEQFYDLRSGLLVFSRAIRAAGPVGRQVVELGFAGQR